MGIDQGISEASLGLVPHRASSCRPTRCRCLLRCMGKGYGLRQACAPCAPVVAADARSHAGRALGRRGCAGSGARARAAARPPSSATRAWRPSPCGWGSRLRRAGAPSSCARPPPRRASRYRALCRGARRYASAQTAAAHVLFGLGCGCLCVGAAEHGSRSLKERRAAASS